MTIKSMTGFARSDGAMGPISWHWEVRSVNGRGLDMRLRLPPGYEALEARIREAVGKRIVRGSLTVNLNVKRSEGETRIKLNESALRQVLAALDSLKGRIETGAAAGRGAARHQGRARGGRAGGERGRDAGAHGAPCWPGSPRRSTAWCARARRRGGTSAPSCWTRSRPSSAWWRSVAASPARSPEAIRQRLKEQIGRLLESGHGPR